MTAQEAFRQLDPKKWADTSARERLRLLKEVRSRIKNHSANLAETDGGMKNKLMGEKLYSAKESMLSTVVPVANTLTACIHLYEMLAKGRMPKAEKITRLSNNIFDVKVKPLDAKDRLMAGTQQLHLRIKGEPKQTNPMDKPAGITAVLGAGNYSSSLEMVKAMFLDNKAVVHKPHRLNEETDRIWEKIFQPLAEASAIAFCGADQGEELTKLNGLSKIYFTGGAGTAKAIMHATDTPLVSECGGNNPCIIVPGIRPWTKKEIEHQAIQIATVSKLNGGAVCGRLQTLVTSKHWPQREEFLKALEKAIEEQTPATGTYYPGSDATANAFRKNYPGAKVLQPEKGKYRNSDFMIVTGVAENGFAVKNEAFCQIIDEVPLNAPAKAEKFLPAAAAFCNSKLLGSLGCCILIDEDTKKDSQTALNQAICELEYGGIAVNTVPPFIFLSPYLTWGGNEKGKEIVSGNGNFGNAYCFENIEKSILTDKFMSMGHMMLTNKKAFEHLAAGMAQFATAPTWINMTKMMGTAIADSFRGRDF